MKYSIYDGSNPRILEANDTEIEAPTARKALQLFLNSKGMGDTQFYNTSDRDVVWQTTPFYERDGRKYRAGRVSWWGIKPQKVS